MSLYTEQEGVVTDIQDDVAHIRIVQHSACLSCQAQSVCTAADSKEKSIAVACRHIPLHVGETVQLVGSRRGEIQTVLLAFLYPFLLLFITLLAVFQTTANEIWTGLSALAILLPYYAALYFCKDKLKKIFAFSIRKTEP